MKRDFLKRLDALESSHSSGTSAAELYDVFFKRGLPVPEPIPGEYWRDYLKRVPSESLTGLLVAYEVMEP